MIKIGDEYTAAVFPFTREYGDRLRVEKSLSIGGVEVEVSLSIKAVGSLDTGDRAALKRWADNAADRVQRHETDVSMDCDDEEEPLSLPRRRRVRRAVADRDD